MKEKEVKEVKKNENKGVKNMSEIKEVKKNENKGIKELEGGNKMEEINKELVREIEKKKGVEEMEVKKNKREVKEIENKKGVEEMEVKELVSKVEEKRVLLIQTVVKWAQTLCPIKSLHVKIKGRYYPLLEKETGKLSVIDKVQGKKISFETLDTKMKFVICEILAERKEEIEKEVEEDKRKYLEKKISEIDELLNKF